MNEIDDLIRRTLKADSEDVPDSVKARVEETLSSLPAVVPKSGSKKVALRIVATAACFLFICLFVFPNFSMAYAEALENIPVIGGIVRVVTVRNYFYSDYSHEMNVDVPRITLSGSDAIDFINKDVDELTGILVDRFYSELDEYSGYGYSSVYTDYEVITNSDTWFTLKISILEIAGSSNTYYKYYHIDKLNGQIAQLSDLAASEEFYTVIENEIRNQMLAQMEADSDLIYWVDDAELGWNFAKLDENHNFYWDENGDLVIAFDKYEVAPGFMGTPEFTISRELLRGLMTIE